MIRPNRGMLSATAATASPWRLWPLATAAALVGAALAVRFANPYDNPDSRAFEALARSVLSGHGLRYREPLLPGLDLFAFRSPGYAVFLAGMLRVGGVPAVLAVQGALVGLAAMLWADIAARVAGWRAGLFAALANLSLGLHWRFAAQLMSEPLYVALLALTSWLATDVAERARAQRAAGPWRVLALGACVAAAVLTRPAGFAIVAAIACLALLVPTTRRALGAALIVALVLWSPWPLRNAARLKAVVPSLTSGGLNAWNGAGHSLDECWRLAADSVALGECGMDRMFWRLTVDETRAHPAAAFTQSLRRAHAYVMPPAPRAAEWPHILLWGPALVAPFTIRRRDDAWWVVPGFALLTWFWHALIGILIVVGDRYRYPTDGIVLMLGAMGVDALLKRYGVARGVLAVALAVTLGVLLAITRHH